MAVNANSGPPYEDVRQPADDDEQLPCGRLLSQVWEGWEDGRPDPHADGCPYCAAALDDLAQLGRAVQEVRDTGFDEADTASLTSRVMDVVRLELRPGRTLPLGDAGDDTWIIEAAAARTLRAAAELLPGVRVGSCRISPLPGSADEPPAVPRGRLRGPVRVRLSAVVTLARPLQETADRIREQVTDAADSALGMSVAAVDVTITDIADDAGQDEGATWEGAGR